MDAGGRAAHGAVAEELVLLCQINAQVVIPARKRVSSAMDGRLKPIHGAWIPAIHAGMTILEKIDHVI
jgi:hypothetical protein